MADSKEPKKKEPQLTRFDLTIPYYDKDGKPKYSDWEAVWRKLDSWSNKFAFQLEKTEKGYWHWQCRVNLVKKLTVAIANKKLQEAIGCNVSPTSSNVHENPKSFNYARRSPAVRVVSRSGSLAFSGSRRGRRLTRLQRPYAGPAT